MTRLNNKMAFYFIWSPCLLYLHVKLLLRDGEIDATYGL